jgi:hypothetical protein
MSGRRIPAPPSIEAPFRGGLYPCLPGTWDLGPSTAAGGSSGKASPRGRFLPLRTRSGVIGYNEWRGADGIGGRPVTLRNGLNTQSYGRVRLA